MSSDDGSDKEIQDLVAKREEELKRPVTPPGTPPVTDTLEESESEGEEETQEAQLSEETETVEPVGVEKTSIVGKLFPPTCFRNSFFARVTHFFGF